MGSHFFIPYGWPNILTLVTLYIAIDNTFYFCGGVHSVSVPLFGDGPIKISTSHPQKKNFTLDATPQLIMTPN
jgi:hypothetical protein